MSELHKDTSHRGVQLHPGMIALRQAATVTTNSLADFIGNADRNDAPSFRRLSARMEKLKKRLHAVAQDLDTVRNGRAKFTVGRTGAKYVGLSEEHFLDTKGHMIAVMQDAIKTVPTGLAQRTEIEQALSALEPVTIAQELQQLFYRHHTSAHDEIVSSRALVAASGTNEEDCRVQGKIIDFDTLMGYMKSLELDMRRNEPARIQLEHRLRSSLNAAHVQPQDTFVMLLIACGGYLTDEGRRRVVTTAMTLNDTFSNIGISFENLGFTTKAWDGGQSRQDWVAKGSPLLSSDWQIRTPGRLNDLRHIIFKTGEESWPEARPNLAMLIGKAGRELCKQTIDGEGLAWARDRALARPESRRLIIAIGNEMPCDDVTTQENPPGYLDRHLRSVIGKIQHEGKIRLASIRLLPAFREDVSHKEPKSVYPNTIDVRFGERPLEKILARADRLALQLTRA